MSTAVFSQPGLNELSVSGLRHDEEVVVSAWLHNPSDGPAFQIIDLLGDELPQRDFMAPLHGAVDEPTDGRQTALWGVSLPSAAGHPSVGFTVSVTLAWRPSWDGFDPEAATAGDAREDGHVSDFILGGVLGYRHERVSTGNGVAGRNAPLLKLTYLAQTPYGILTVAFGTAHLDTAEVFVALFDRIADSVRVVSTHRPPAL